MTFKRSLLLSAFAFSALMSHTALVQPAYSYDVVGAYDMDRDGLLKREDKGMVVKDLLNMLEKQTPETLTLTPEDEEDLKLKLTPLKFMLKSLPLEMKHTRELTGDYSYDGYVVQTEYGVYVPISDDEKILIEKYKEWDMSTFLTIYGQYRSGKIGDPKTGAQLNVNSLVQEKKDLEAKLKQLSNGGGSALRMEELMQLQAQTNLIVDLLMLVNKAVLDYQLNATSLYVSPSESLRSFVEGLRARKRIKQVSEIQTETPASENEQSGTEAPQPLHTQMGYNPSNPSNPGNTGNTPEQDTSNAPKPGLDPSTTPNSSTFGNGDGGAFCDALCQSMKL
jgi:hypothetical protein